MYKTLWMTYFLMGIKKTNTRTRRTPYAWLMEIIRLQTLNHKSCSTNLVLQNGRNHNYFMEKVQAFGTIRSCPFKALRLPKERIGLGTRRFVRVEVLIGPILGVGSMRPWANMGLVWLQNQLGWLSKLSSWLTLVRLGLSLDNKV